ncbi:MAG: RNA polymerase sigma-70 factor [Bacteroidales bacterium]|nr:RNA polymerase sigma-70 factor [Bacteroidales bacterium]
MDKDERHIINRLKQGDKVVFDKLFRCFYSRMVLYAGSYISDRDTAEDIVQDIFLHLWNKRKETFITTSVSSYLFRAVHNKCIQHLRHMKVTAAYEERHRLKLKEAELLYNSSGDFNFSELQLTEIQRILNESYQLLPEKTRQIFLLSKEKDNSNRKIAELLNINIKTVEYHITKTLKVLRTALNDFFTF